MARAHEYGRRRGGPFVAINMAAIPRDLIRSELFGHERAPSPARRTAPPVVSNRRRVVHSSSTKSATCRWKRRTRLLRVLQQGEYTTVGGRTPIKTDVRIVAAQQGPANADQPGAFPRGSVLSPERRPAAAAGLRERSRTFRISSATFSSSASVKACRPSAFPPAASELMKRYPWPGTCASSKTLSADLQRSIRRTRFPPRSSRPN